MLRFTKVSIVLLTSLLIFTSCDRANQMVSDVHTEPPTDETPGTPITSIMLIDYPEGGKAAYLQWIASIAPTLQAPEEIIRIRAYDNVDPEASPHRMITFEYGSFLEATRYMSRPEIVAILEDLPNHATQVASHIFIQRSAWQQEEAHHGEHHHYPLKSIVLINYHLGGRDAYLEWAASVGATLVAAPQLKTLGVYENYYGEPPHRLLIGEFLSEAEADAYNALPEIQAIEAELNTQAANWVEHRFQLRSDYVNE